MKNLNLFLSIAVSLTILSFSGCKDDETTEVTPTKTKTQLLCAHNWITVGFKVEPPINAGGVQISDLFAQFEDCEKDDLVKYNENNTGFSDEGPTKCFPTDPQTTSFNWAFSADEKSITENNEDTYIIEKLTETEFIVTQTLRGNEIGSDLDLNYTITASFKKK